MGMLTLEGGELVITPELLSLPAFEEIWTRDKSPLHAKAIKELSYIYLMYDYSSPFRQYNEADGTRRLKVLEALECELTIDIVVQKATELYREIHVTYSMALLEAAEIAVHKLKAYFKDVDLLEVNEKDQPIYKATDLMNNLKNIGGVIMGLKELKSEVEKERSENKRIRGGTTIESEYEKPRK